MEKSINNENNGAISKDGLIGATWIVLIIAWLFLLIPGLGWLGFTLAFVSIILSIVLLAKGKNVKKGVLLLLLSILGTPLVYIISWLLIAII